MTPKSKPWVGGRKFKSWVSDGCPSHGLGWGEEEKGRHTKLVKIIILGIFKMGFIKVLPRTQAQFINEINSIVCAMQQLLPAGVV